MSDDFLSTLIDNSARAKLLRVFLFNDTKAFGLKDVAKSASVTPKIAQKEIDALFNMGVIKRGQVSIMLANGTGRTVQGKQKEPAWTVNPTFKHMQALSKFVHEVAPAPYRKVVTALREAGRLSAIVLSGYFMGDPSRPIDLLVAADSVKEDRLEQAVKGLELVFGREIRYAVFSTPEFRYRLTIQDRLIRDTLDYPHLALLDRTNLL
ncbi:hypothetical protein A2673_00045 [Candidatus Kaiserbacteria bacterium RIFCSPHIGHO2_01_FULL_50_13]|uniref:Polymerase nucleotidyl transferase domain-containing protein n=1 Tax=Candidatus Kaiserbacteria bacterium RIFCSPLOWO2_01_FULL_50_24 TaxID=1798507 RepID=A0A1F6EQY8_9BACT|nr:MAG: hypothetical protein A2673_00045 [Candidatus Kaiserbacteria bacterium RIFCSPHIGHO2_01_FULL_50_13]OGG76049.1 MAG: hypothetical protein A3A34_00685 [Candidatus Kaiserbacteria bacterium RIFCSPLOWO2_01_FULL_50_24]OGG81339.1 MAG: hypothetical protein A3H74_02200 [Candidatus Kaiserbacteria bacterium RIFCSPLOWO2_02_FULL_51_13]